MKSFFEQLKAFIQRDKRKAAQLAREAEKLFGTDNFLNRKMIDRWKSGAVTRPQSFIAILQLAAVLQLSSQEVDGLLKSANHPSLTEIAQKEFAQKANLLSYFQSIPLNNMDSRGSDLREQPYFVGRSAEITTLTNLLIKEKRQVTCVYGIYGVGKRELVRHVIAQTQAHFPDGVLWHDAQQKTLMHILADIGQHLGEFVQLIGDEQERLERIHNILQHKQLLLVITNVAYPAEYVDLLPPENRWQLLLTATRLLPRLPTKTGWLKLEPFATNSPAPLQILAHHIGQPQINAQREIYEQLITTVGRLPAALQLIGRSLKTATVSLESLQQALQANQLRILGREGIEMQKTLDAVCHTLSHRQQSDFAALCTLRGRFDIDAAMAVLNLSRSDAVDALEQLVNRSFLRATADGWFEFYPIMRAFGQKNVETQYQERMAAHFISQLVADRAAIGTQYLNFRTALDYAYVLQNADQVIAGTFALIDYLVGIEGNVKCAEMLKRVEEFISAENHPRLQYEQARLFARQGKYLEAVQQYQTALQHSDDDSLTSQIYLSLGATYQRQRENARAENYYQLATEYATRCADSQLVFRATNNLAIILKQDGAFAAAQQLFQKAFDMVEIETLMTHSRRDVARLLLNWGTVIEKQGNYALAHQKYLTCLQVIQPLRDGYLECSTLSSLGLLALAMGNAIEATGLFRTGLTLAQTRNDGLMIVQQLANLGHANTVRRKYENAELNFAAALEQANQHNFGYAIAIICNRWGDCLLQSGKLGEAQARFQEALENSRGDVEQKAMALFGMAQIAARSDVLHKAQRLGEESRELFQKINSHRQRDVLWWLRELPAMKPPQQVMADEIYSMG